MVMVKHGKSALDQLTFIGSGSGSAGVDLTYLKTFVARDISMDMLK